MPRTADQEAAYLLQREALRRAATQPPSDSPAALESTLARISAEMTEEAEERRHRAGQ